MIVLRQNSYADTRKPRIPQTEEEFNEVIKRTKDESYKRGKEAGYRAGKQETVDRFWNLRNKKRTAIKNVKTWGKKNKTGLIITAAGLAASGAGYGIYKGVKKVKAKKGEKDLKKKVRGYDK